MQTFLPYSSFTESANCLDGKRLSKQNLETFQILNTLSDISHGWQSHPAVLAWKGHEKALLEYGLTINSECVKRGFKDKKDDYYSKYIELFKNNPLSHPDWLGDIKVHNSHKSRLICKGLIDAYCAAIKKHLKIKSMDDWLKERYKKTKNQLKFNDTFVLSDFIIENKIDNVPVNYYRQFNWEENSVDVHPKNDYVWPVSKE